MLKRSCNCIPTSQACDFVVLKTWPEKSIKPQWIVYFCHWKPVPPLYLVWRVRHIGAHAPGFLYFVSIIKLRTNSFWNGLSLKLQSTSNSYLIPKWFFLKKNIFLIEIDDLEKKIIRGKFFNGNVFIKKKMSRPKVLRLLFLNNNKKSFGFCRIIVWTRRV